MKFGVRQICNVVFRAAQSQKIGSVTYKRGQPVFYIDSAKTSTIEGAATTVYATGGRGNTRLIAWEGEKTLTFTVEQALLSPISFAMLSGAGLIKAASNSTDTVHFHQTTSTVTDADGKIDLHNALLEDEIIDSSAPVYVLNMENGDLTGDFLDGYSVANVTNPAGGSPFTSQGLSTSKTGTDLNPYKNKPVLVDYYVVKKANKVSELQINAEDFAGYYYVEADTLFRRQIDGKDLPANITLPNVKIQSNFTFSMASTGDPSTFTFTMDAFPGYTYFDKTKKVLCAIQIADDSASAVAAQKSVFSHAASNEDIDTLNADTTDTFGGSADSVTSGG